MRTNAPNNRTASLPWALGLILLTLGGCGLDDLGVPHPVDGLDYPVALTADPSGRTVWVSSGNFDLAYGGGAVLGIDVATHTFIPGAAAEVGSFPGAFHVLNRDGKAAHGYVLSRETNALYHLEIGGSEEAPTLACSGGTTDPSGLVRCANLGLSEASVSGLGDPIKVGNDPFGAILRPAQGPGEVDLLLTGALAENKLATFELDADGRPHLVGSLATSSPVFALAAHPSANRIYTTSKNVNVLNVYRVRPTADSETSGNPWLEAMDAIVLPTASLLNMDHARGLALTADGTRLLALHRSPAALYLVDVREVAGDVHDQVLTKVSLCARPGEITMVPPTADGNIPELAYISCFGGDAIDVIDPRDGQHVGQIRTGRGPFGMAFVTNAELGLRRLYVANFHSQSVGVIELDPTSPYFHTQIAEIR